MLVLTLFIAACTAAWANPQWPDLGDPPASAASATAEQDAALIVAIEDYAFLDDIPGAATNARDWERWLRRRGVPSPHLHVVMDRPEDQGGTPSATREEILRRASRAAEQVGPDGKLWIVFIGHGAPATGDDVLLLGADTGRSAEGFVARGVRRTELLEITREARGTPILVLDTCFSGQATSGEPLLDVALQPALLTSLAPATAVELLATSRDQFAGPLPGEPRPAFSYLVLGALRGWADEAVGASADGTITAQEAWLYVRETLGMLLTGRAQDPVLATPSDDLRQITLSQGDERGPDRVALRDALAASPTSTVVGQSEAVITPVAPEGGWSPPDSRISFGFDVGPVVAGFVEVRVDVHRRIALGVRPFGALGVNTDAWPGGLRNNLWLYSGVQAYLGVAVSNRWTLAAGPLVQLEPRPGASGWVAFRPAEHVAIRAGLLGTEVANDPNLTFDGGVRFVW